MKQVFLPNRGARPSSSSATSSWFVCCRALLVAGAMLGLIAATAAAAPKEITWVGCGVSKLGFMQDLAAAYEKKTGVKIKISGGGATKGIREVATEKSHLGGSCRLPLIYKPGQNKPMIDQAETNIRLIPVGWDALVVLVHKNNRMIDSITRADLRRVLTGEIRTWDQLGAQSNEPINLYVRKGKISGVGLTLRQQLFNNVHQEFSEHAQYLKSSGKVEKAIEEDPYGIAVSGISSTRHRDVRMLRLDGITPTMDALKSGKYLLYRILFLVAPPNYKEQPELNAFVDFAFSLEGQRVILEAGTLPYHRGISLLRTAASVEYLRTIETVDRKGIYTLGGH